MTQVVTLSSLQMTTPTESHFLVLQTNPFVRLSFILEQFKDANDPDSESLHKWGAYILRDFKDSTDLSQALAVESRKRVNDLMKNILKITKDGKHQFKGPIEFGKEMTDWVVTMMPFFQIASQAEQNEETALIPAEIADDPKTVVKYKRLQKKLKRIEKMRTSKEDAEMFTSLLQLAEKMTREATDKLTVQLRENWAEHEKQLRDDIDRINHTNGKKVEALENRIKLSEERQHTLERDLKEQKVESDKLKELSRDLSCGLVYERQRANALEQSARDRGGSCVIL